MPPDSGVARRAAGGTLLLGMLLCSGSVRAEEDNGAHTAGAAGTIQPRPGGGAPHADEGAVKLKPLSMDEPGAAQRLTSESSPPPAITRSATQQRSSAQRPEPSAAAQRQERADREILRHKRQQVISLRRLITAEGDPPVRLFQLARLELEVVILAEAIGQQASLGTPVMTCRRILAQWPSYPEADEVRLFLAQLERRRGRTSLAREVIADLERLHPRSPRLCQAWLLEAETRQREERFDLALDLYQRSATAGGCSTQVVHQARYGAAWSLLGMKRYRAAVKTLRLLLSQQLAPLFKERVLKDLVVAWSMSEVEPDTVELIMKQGSPQLGGRLIRQLARSLVREGRLQPLLSLTSAFLTRFPSHPLGAALREARLEGIARLSTAAALRRELSSLTRPSPELRAAMAEALLVMARRAEGNLAEAEAAAADRDQAQALYRRLIRAFSTSPQAQQARVRLAELRLDEGGFSPAVALLLEARRAGPLEPRAQVQLVYGLSGMLEQGGLSDPAATLARFSEEVWRLVEQQPRGGETAEALLNLGGRLLKARQGEEAARAALTLIQRFPGEPRRTQAAALAVRALAQSSQLEEAFNLATAELRRKPTNRSWLRRAAAAAAMKRCQALATERRFEAARQWARRAVAADPDHPDRFEAALISAAMSARAGAADQARREYQELSSGSVPSTFRLRALMSLAELSESQGDFAGAARAYDEATPLSGHLGESLKWIYRAGLAHASAGAGAIAVRRARELTRRLSREPLPAARMIRWQLRAGEVLQQASVGGAAARHYINRAMEWRRQDPRASARFLLRAAALPVPGHKVMSYLTQAVQLAGPLTRRGRTSALAARARVGLARATRSRLEAQGRGARSAARGPRHLAALQKLVADLLPVIKTGHPRFAVEAGLQITWAYGALVETMERAPLPVALSTAARAKVLELVRARVSGLRRAKARLIEGLTPLIRRGVHSSAALAELRQHTSPGLAVARMEILPAPHPTHAPLLGLLRAGRHSAATVALSSALLVQGPREDLLCLRGVARLRAGELSMARRDFEAARRLSSESRCARLNLAALAVRRGDLEAATLVLGDLKGHQARVLNAALAYGRGQYRRAETLARRAIKEDPRSSARFLLGVVLLEHLNRPGEGQALLRRCVEDDLKVSDLARDSLSRTAGEGAQNPRSSGV